MKKAVLFFVLVCSVGLTAFAQPDRKEIRAGNRMFGRDRYEDAIKFYNASLEKDPESFAAQYNLASSHFKIALGNGDRKADELESATRNLESVASVADSTLWAADYHFNNGTVCLNREQWQEAKDAFRKVLVLDPDDDRARESYLYASDRLREQQNQDQDQQQDQQQDQDQDQNQDQQQDQNQQQNQDQQQDQQREGSGQPKISPEQAERMLAAIREKEKDTQEKVREKQAAAVTREKEKNW